MTEPQPPSRSSESPEPSVLDVVHEALKGHTKALFGIWLSRHNPSDCDPQETGRVNQGQGAEGKLSTPGSRAHSASERATPHLTLVEAFRQVWYTEDVREPALSKVSPFRLSSPQIAVWGSVLLAAVLVLAFRSYRLDNLQAEFYGDIVTVYDYSNAVMTHQWPFEFILSAGPFYFYLIWPLLALLGLSYGSLKLASVVVSLLTLMFTYVFARELVDERFALLTTAIAGVSSWLLIFSRLGNFPIAVPLVVMAALWLLARFVRTHSRWDLIGCSLVAALGPYIYPQTFILPLVIVLTLIALSWPWHQFRWSNVLLMMAVTLAGSLPWFFFIFLKSPEAWFVGYVGGKLTGVHTWLPILLGNIIHGLGAFHIRGDMVSRSNPAGLPFLDPLSGLLFLFGLAFWLSPSRRRWLPIILIPFLLLQLPSILVLSNPQEIPSATRTLGIAPIAYLLVSSGSWLLAQVALRLFGPRTGFISSIVMFLLIAAINGGRYFDTYIHGLPYHNTPIAALAADYANRLPPGTHVYLVDCCWEGAMPEPKGVRYSMSRPSELSELRSSDLTCDLLDGLAEPAVLIWSERRDLPSDELAGCANKLMPQTYYSLQGLPVFRAASLGAGGAVEAANNPAPVATAVPQGLVASPAVLDGAPVTVYHSALDMGQVSDIFDGNKETLMRSAGANPFIVEIHFDRVRKLSELGVTVATMNHFSITVIITYEDGTTDTVNGDYVQLPPDPTVALQLPASDKAVKILHIEIKDIRPKPADGYHVHVREISVQ